MSSNEPQSGAAELRARAEALTRESAPSPEHLAALSQETTRAMLHEMQVHQIELELQNEELRRAQLALKDSQARYFDLYDQAPVGYITVSEPGLILEANLTACTLLGVARSALARQPFTRFIFREDQDPYYLLRNRLFETGEPQAGELRLAKLDGTPCWVQLAATTAPGTDGAAVGRLGLIDISQRKRTEMRAAEQLEELQRWQAVMLEREERVQELKREINDLCRQSGAVIRYPSQETVAPSGRKDA